MATKKAALLVPFVALATILNPLVKVNVANA